MPIPRISQNRAYFHLESRSAGGVVVRGGDSCSEWGGGGTEAAIFIWPLFWWAKAGNAKEADIWCGESCGKFKDLVCLVVVFMLN